MIDPGAMMSGCATAICCALHLNRMATTPERCPGQRAIYTVDALHDVPPIMAPDAAMARLIAELDEREPTS